MISPFKVVMFSLVVLVTNVKTYEVIGVIHFCEDVIGNNGLVRGYFKS